MNPPFEAHKNGINLISLFTDKIQKSSDILGNYIFSTLSSLREPEPGRTSRRFARRTRDPLPFIHYGPGITHEISNRELKYIISIFCMAELDTGSLSFDSLSRPVVFEAVSVNFGGASVISGQFTATPTTRLATGELDE